MRVFSGIEGGATRTTCVVGDQTGRLLGVGCGGPSNYLTAGVDGMKKSLADSVQSALRGAGLKVTPEATYAGLAGIGLSGIPRAVKLAAKKATGSKKILIDTDGAVALYGAFAGGPGMIVVSGTGSVAMGIDDKGEKVRVGGWGHILGDEGSAFHIGLEGLRAVVRSYDGLLPPTELTREALSSFRIQQVEELVSIFYSKGVGKERLAAFSKNVMEVASKGDSLAIGIVDSACETLGRMVQVLLRRLSFDRPRLVLSGGVFEGSRWFRKRFMESLHADVETVSPMFTPVTGALMLALSSCGLKLAPEVLDNIRQSENVSGLSARSNLRSPSDVD